MEEKRSRRKIAFQVIVLVEMVMTDEAWFVVRNTPNVTGFVGSHGIDQNQLHYWNKKFVISWFLWDKLYKSLISMLKFGQTVRIIDGAFADYTGKIIEIDNNKVR